MVARMLKIVGIGDSTTAGTPGFLSPLEAPPNGFGNPRSQYAFWMMEGHPEWSVLNKGINGQRSDEVLARFDRDDVVKEELDNIVTEFYGYGHDRPSHYELLLRMGESLGMDRQTILSTPALPSTAKAIATWQQIGEKRHWVETMAAMHSLELIANRKVIEDGARITYFDPSIFTSNQVTEATKAFLREGYEADVEHSEVPLEAVEKYATELRLVEDVQVTFVTSSHG